MRCSARIALTTALALAAAGCTKNICSRSSDCTTGLVCTSAGNCEVPADASTDDGGTGTTADASVDAGTTTTPIGDASPDAFVDGGDAGDGL